MRQATARERSHPRPVQRPPRRVSGPVAAPAAAPALRRRGTTAVFEALKGLPEHRVVDRLLRSRLWIIVIGSLLGGIVAMQVSLLKLNSGISRAVETSATLERQNAALEASIARLGATERVRATAASRGMVLPPAGDVRFLRPRPFDAARAAATMEPPSEAARDLLANGGIVPGTLAAEPVIGTVAEETVAGTAVTTDPTAVTTDPTAVTTDPTTVTTDPTAVVAAE